MSDPKEPLRRYLLGLATTEETEAIEREVLRSDDSVEGVAAVEDELIEDYLEGGGSAETRERFERHYLASPVHARRVAIVRDLRRRAARPRRRRWVLPSLAAAAIVAFGLFVALDRDRAIVLQLPAVAERSEGITPTVELADGSRSVELRLERLGDAPGTLPAVVRDVEGSEIWRGTATRDGASWIVTVPPATLFPGDFFLEIGDGPLQRAYFRAVP